MSKDRDNNSIWNNIARLWTRAGSATEDFLRKDGTTPLTGNWDAGAFRIRVGSGANYLQIAADGELTLVGAARIVRSFDIEAIIPSRSSGNPPALDNKDNFTMLRFDRATEEEVFFHFEIPHNYASAGFIHIHFEFLVENPPVAPAGNEAVVMGVEYKEISDGEVFDFSAGTSFGTVTETITEDETAEIIHRTDHISLTTTGLEPNDTLLMRLYRDATNPADTYDNAGAPADNDVWVFNFHGEYLSDRLGEAT